jgi:hypothetical protein
VLEGEVRSFTTAGTTPQSIELAVPPPLEVGTPTALPAPTATSGLPVTLTSTSPTVCTVSGTTVTPLAVGTCVLAADQPGDRTYAPATRVVRTATVTALAVAPRTQTIAFAPQRTHPIGTTTVELSATASSGLPVSFSVDPASSGCTVSGSTLTFAGPGSCTVVADQPGDDHFVAAPRVTAVLEVPAAPAVAPKAQAITFSPQRTFPVGTTTVELSATASSGLPVSFSVDPASSGCTVSGSTLTFAGPGSCTVLADQPGDRDFLAAPRVTATLTVAAREVTPPVGAPAPPPTARPELPAPPVERVQGRERTETAAQLAEQLYPQPRTAKVVVLARSDVYADGLTGSPLAGTLDGPVLLTQPEQLSEATAQALRRVLAADATVYVLGGPRAVSPGVAAEVAGMGYR